MTTLHLTEHDYLTALEALGHAWEMSVPVTLTSKDDVEDTIEGIAAFLAE